MSTLLRVYTIIFVFFAACVGTPPGGDPGGDPGGNTGGNGNGDGNGDGTSVADFAAAMAHHECDDAFACKADFPTDAGVTFEEAFGASVDACYGDAGGYWDAAAIEAAIAGGTITYDGTAAEACIAGLAAPTCSTYWTDGPDDPDACDTAMVGTVADGGACTIDFECSFDSYCETAKCTAIPAGQRRAPALPLLAR